MIWTLLIVYQLKHFLADYLFQTRYMLGKFRNDGWVLPLLSHAAVHGIGTVWITLLVPVSAGIAAGLALFDVAMHFIIDRVKASPHLLGRWTNQQPAYWYTLGADQMAHHLTHYLIIYLLVTA